MKHKKILTMLIAGMVMCSSGCSEIKPDTPEAGKYSTMNRLSAAEYSIYINKQISVFTNQITTRMGVAKNLSEGYDADNEYKLAADSLKTMKETLNETSTVYPSTGSDDNRESVITAMQTAVDHMEGYAEAVKNKEDVKGYTKDFENDFNQLTGIANMYNQ